MSDLILKTRLAVTRQGLEQIRDLLANVRARRAQLDELQTLLGETAPGSLGRVLRQLNVATTAIDGVRASEVTDDMVGDVRRALAGAKQEVEALRRQVEGVQQMLAELRGRSVDITGDVETNLEFGLVIPAQDCLDKINEIDATIMELGAQPGDESNGVLLHAWREFATGVCEPVQGIYDAYADLLGGLAARENGFDRDVCAAGDKLVQDSIAVQDFGRGLLMIPARSGAEHGPGARLIRLSFPEWSIWTLPLAAFDYGRMLVETRAPFPEYVARYATSATEKLALRQQLAHAFATCVMGPAYACAAITLRFEPSSSTQPPEVGTLNADSVHIILSSLEKIAPPSGEQFESPMSADGSLDQIIQRLRLEWTSACALIGSPATPPDDEQKVLTAHVNHVFQFVRQNVLRRYKLADWNLIKPWPDHLNPCAIDQLQITGTENWRDILNAIWLTRILAGNEADLRAIDTCAHALWHKIELKRSEQGGKHVELSFRDASRSR